MSDEQTPLQAAIAAAMSPDEGVNVPEAQIAASEPENGAEPAVEEATPERARDEAGKFAKKAETAQDAEPPSEAPNVTDDTPSVQPPKSWKPAARAAFAELPPLVQQEVTRREMDMAQGVQQLKERHASVAWVEDVIAPHKERLALQGLTPQTYVSQLAAADELLRRDFGQGLQMLHQLYGQPYSAPQGQFPGQQPQPQAGLPPQFQGLFSEVQQLKQTLSAQQRAEEDRQRQAIQAQIETFAADKPYFGDVELRMAALLQTGQAANLEQAYEMACWADPEIRPLLQQDAQKKAEAERLKAERAKAGAARQAGGSVRGSPTGSVVNGATSNPSLREAINSAVAGVSGRA